MGAGAPDEHGGMLGSNCKEWDLSFKLEVWESSVGFEVLGSLTTSVSLSMEHFFFQGIFSPLIR